MASRLKAPIDAAGYRVVVADDGVLHGVREREQHHQVEGVELGQFALAEEAQQQHQNQVDDDRAKQLLQNRKRQLKHVVEDKRMGHGIEDSWPQGFLSRRRVTSTVWVSWFSCMEYLRTAMATVLASGELGGRLA